MTTISVVTPSYNRVDFIRTAIDSVLVQGYSEFEHIIVDGGSTDGTLELLSYYPHLRVISEPDQGVYDALNKGIALARGEIVAQLNTDDLFEPGIFPLIVNLFAQNPSADAVSGGARIFELHSAGERTTAEYGGITHNEIPYRATLGAPIFNAWFFRKRIFDRIGYYSLEYPLIADRDFLLRCYLSKVNVVSIESTVYHYLQHPGSLTINNQSAAQLPVLLEILRLTEKYLESKQLDSTVKRFCSEWHDLNAIELAISFVRQAKIPDLFRTIRSAVKHNLYWPLTVAMQTPTRIRNFIRKKYASNR